MVSKESIDERLRELRMELERGYRRLALLEKEREEARDTLLRIKGAIQVLEELSHSDSGIAEEAQAEDLDNQQATSS
jgi:hypothetical protein